MLRTRLTSSIRAIKTTQRTAIQQITATQSQRFLTTSTAVQHVRTTSIQSNGKRSALTASTMNQPIRGFASSKCQ